MSRQLSVTESLSRRITRLREYVEANIGSGGGGAPTGASYVTLGTNGTLTDERVLTAGDGVTVTDAGAGSTVTVAADITRARAMAFVSLGL